MRAFIYTLTFLFVSNIGHAQDQQGHRNAESKNTIPENFPAPNTEAPGDVKNVEPSQKLLNFLYNNGKQGKLPIGLGGVPLNSILEKVHNDRREYSETGRLRGFWAEDVLIQAGLASPEMKEQTHGQIKRLVAYLVGTKQINEKRKELGEEAIDWTIANVQNDSLDNEDFPGQGWTISETPVPGALVIQPDAETRGNGRNGPISATGFVGKREGERVWVEGYKPTMFKFNEETERNTWRRGFFGKGAIYLVPPKQ